MKKLVLASAVIAVLAALFASSLPDGLDYVSGVLGFGEKGVERTSMMTDYSVPFLPEGWISTSAAGMAGIALSFLLFWGFAKFLRKGTDNNRTLAVLLALMLLTSSAAFAARPLTTDDNGTADTKLDELELFVTRQYVGNAGPEVSSVGYLFKWALTPSMDIGVSKSFYLLNPNMDGDPVASVKARLIDNGEEGGLSLRLDVKAVHHGYSTGYPDYSAKLLYSTSSGCAKYHFNLGYTIVGIPSWSPNLNTVDYSAAFETGLSDTVGICGEYVASASPVTNSSSVLAGLRWAPAPFMTLDLGYCVALSGPTSNFMTAGTTFKFDL